MTEPSPDDLIATVNALQAKGLATTMRLPVSVRFVDGVAELVDESGEVVCWMAESAYRALRDEHTKTRPDARYFV